MDYNRMVFNNLPPPPTYGAPQQCEENFYSAHHDQRPLQHQQLMPLGQQQYQPSNPQAVGHVIQNSEPGFSQPAQWGGQVGSTYHSAVNSQPAAPIPQQTELGLSSAAQNMNLVQRMPVSLQSGTGYLTAATDISLLQRLPTPQQTGAGYSAGAPSMSPARRVPTPQQTGAGYSAVAPSMSPAGRVPTPQQTGAGVPDISSTLCMQTPQHQTVSNYPPNAPNSNRQRRPMPQHPVGAGYCARAPNMVTRHRMPNAHQRAHFYQGHASQEAHCEGSQSLVTPGGLSVSGIVPSFEEEYISYGRTPIPFSDSSRQLLRQLPHNPVSVLTRPSIPTSRPQFSRNGATRPNNSAHQGAQSSLSQAPPSSKQWDPFNYEVPQDTSTSEPNHILTAILSMEESLDSSRQVTRNVSNVKTGKEPVRVSRPMVRTAPVSRSGQVPGYTAPVSISRQGPQQTAPASTMPVQSFHSDVEAMRASFVSNIIQSVSENANSVKKLPHKAPQQSAHGKSLSKQGANSPNIRDSSLPNHQNSVPAKSHQSTSSDNLVKSGSKLAALETIRIKQEAMENLGKVKSVQSGPQPQNQGGVRQPSQGDQSTSRSCALSRNKSPTDSQSLTSNKGSTNGQPGKPSSEKLGKESLGSAPSTSNSKPIACGHHEKNSLQALLAPDIRAKANHRDESAMLSDPSGATSSGKSRGENSSLSSSKSRVVPPPKAKTPSRQKATELTSKALAKQCGPPESKRQMTAKEKVYSMWRDGTVVGRAPAALKRLRPEPPTGRDNFVPASISSAHVPRPPLNKTQNVGSSLCFVMIHGYRMICLKNSKELSLLLDQFLFECFPDKGLGSVNNCIERSLRIKTKALNHVKQKEIEEYLTKNKYRTRSEILTLNVADALRVYHHMYGIKNCASASCVVEQTDQSVDLALAGVRSQPKIKKEKLCMESSPYENTHVSTEVRTVGRQEGAQTGSETGVDDEVMIVRVEENPNMITYSSNEVKNGGLYKMLVGTVRSYVHKKETYLVVPDLSQLFGEDQFNSWVDLENLALYSCCSEIGAFINQISNDFPCLSSFHECLVKEADLGVHPENDSQMEGAHGLNSGSRSVPCLKQEVIEEQTLCSSAKQPRLNEVAVNRSHDLGNSSDSDQDSSAEPSLRIDLGVSPGTRRESNTDKTSELCPQQTISEKALTDKVRPEIVAELTQVTRLSPSPESRLSCSSVDTSMSASTLANQSGIKNCNQRRRSSVDPNILSPPQSLSSRKIVKSVVTMDDSEVMTSAGSHPMGRGSTDVNKTKSFLVTANSQLCQRNDALISVLQKLRKDYATCKKELIEKTAENDSMKATNKRKLDEMRDDLESANKCAENARTALAASKAELEAKMKELVSTRAAKTKLEAVCKHLEEAFGRIAQQMQDGSDSSEPIVIDGDDV